jgi:hypothetical protein
LNVFRKSKRCVSCVVTLALGKWIFEWSPKSRIFCFNRIFSYQFAALLRTTLQRISPRAIPKPDLQNRPGRACLRVIGLRNSNTIACLAQLQYGSSCLVGQSKLFLFIAKIFAIFRTKIAYLRRQNTALHIWPFHSLSSSFCVQQWL